MKDFQLPGLEKTENEFLDIQAMDDFFKESLINQPGAEGIESLDVSYSNVIQEQPASGGVDLDFESLGGDDLDKDEGGWYKNLNYDPETEIEDDPSTHEYQWFDTIEDREGFEYIGYSYISKDTELGQMTVHGGKTGEEVFNLKKGRLDMVMASRSQGAFNFREDDIYLLNSYDVYKLIGNGKDLNALTWHLSNADVKFGTAMFVGHGSYNYDSQRFMVTGDSKIFFDDTLFKTLKDTKFAKSFDASSDLILYQCAGARATEKGLEQDLNIYKQLSQALGGASIYISYGAVLPNPFENLGDTTGDAKSAKSYFKGKKKAKSIKKIIKNNALWLKVQGDKAYHLYGFRLKLKNDQLEITTEEVKDAKASNFK